MAQTYEEKIRSEVRATYCSRGDEDHDRRLAYAHGHRDAVAAAAAIAQEADAELVKAEKRWRDIADEQPEEGQVIEAQCQDYRNLKTLVGPARVGGYEHSRIIVEDHQGVRHAYAIWLWRPVQKCAGDGGKAGT